MGKDPVAKSDDDYKNAMQTWAEIKASYNNACNADNVYLDELARGRISGRLASASSADLPNRARPYALTPEVLKARDACARVAWANGAAARAAEDAEDARAKVFKARAEVAKAAEVARVARIKEEARDRAVRIKEESRDRAIRKIDEVRAFWAKAAEAKAAEAEKNKDK